MMIRDILRNQKIELRDDYYLLIDEVGNLGDKMIFDISIFHRIEKDIDFIDNYIDWFWDDNIEDKNLFNLLSDLEYRGEKNLEDYRKRD